jgi:carboxyl-terminal processing protease
MENKKALSKKKLTILLSGALACVLCFSAGLAIPLLKQSNSTNTSLSKLSQVLNILENNWYYSNKIDDLDSMLTEQAITGMTSLSQDLHTNYFTVEQAQQVSTTLAGSNVGVGLAYYVDQEGNMIVRFVYSGSTADQGGLAGGDIIESVEGIDAFNNSDAVVDLIKESEGQTLSVTYTRDGQEYTTSLVPGSYDTSVYVDMQPEYARIAITSFSEGTAQTFANALASVKEAGYDSIILDLRDNGGGYLSAAQGVAASLLPQESVVMIEEDKDGNRKDVLVSSQYEQIDLDQIVILQNENSASASEVMIGTLKDNLGDKVITVGQNSYGKGTEQVSVPFSDGTSLKYTVAKWYTPNGTSIDLVGFEPDITIEEADVFTVSYTQMEEDDVIEPDTVADNAAAVQVYLAYLGYPADRTDAYFSEQGSYALSLFQADHGLEADGILDYESFNALVAAIRDAIYLDENGTDATLLKAVEILNQQDYNE